MREETKKLKQIIRNMSPLQKKEAKVQIDKEWLKRWQAKEEDFWRYVYVMKCEDFYKIGIASRLDDRLNQIQTGNPFQVSIVFGLKHKKADEIETKLHEIFLTKRVKREWFALEAKDLDFIREYIEKYEA